MRGSFRLWPQSLAFCTIWILYILLHSGETVTDTLMASTLVPNLAQGHGIDLSKALLGSDLLRDQPAYYVMLSSYGLVGIYPVGMVLLAAPLQAALWLLAYLMGLEVSVDSPYFTPTRFIIEKISASFLVALTGISVYQSLRLLVPRAYAAALSFVYIFGSGALSLLAQGLWQQTGINLLCVLLLHFLLMRDQPVTKRNEAAFFGALGFLFSIRPTTVVWGIFFGLSFWRLFGRPSWIAVASACTGILPGLVWNLSLFGEPLGGYAVTSAPVLNAEPIACAERVWRILFGGHKGLLVLNPLLAGLFLAPLALPALDQRYRTVLAPLLVSILCNLLLCSTNPSWHGGRGFGPRYMLDGLGIAFVLSGVGIANAAKHLPRVAAGLVGIAGAYSIVLNLVGAIGSRLRGPWLVELHQRMLLP